MKKILAISIAVTNFLLIPLNAANPSIDELLTATDTGSESVTATVTSALKATIDNKFKNLVLETEKITDEFNAKLDAFVTANRGEPGFLDFFEKKKNGLITDFQAKLKAESEKLKLETLQIGNDVTASIKESIDERAPFVNVDAEYGYCEGEEAIGTPGWKTNDTFITGFTGVKGSGEIFYKADANVRLDASVVVAQASFSFDFKASYEVSVNVSAALVPRTPSTPSPKNRPQATTDVGSTLSITGAVGTAVQFFVLGASVNSEIAYNSNTGLVNVDLDSGL